MRLKIPELLAKKRTFSFEVFPPKEGVPLGSLTETLDRLYGFKPDFVSVTYGAGGTNKGRSVELCRLVAGSGNLVMPHFTCIGNTKEMIRGYLDEYLALGVENMLLLRGDLPEGWTGTRGDFDHASELIAYFKQLRPELSISAAAYPEVHTESATPESDARDLKRRQDAGADFCVTQLCHDVDAYERFTERIRRAGVTLPVVVGLMPILSRAAVIRMTLSNGCSIPADLAAICGRYEKDEESFLKAGKEFTARLIERYIAADIDGLHLYTLNKYEDVSEIIQNTDWKGFR